MDYEFDYTVYSVRFYHARRYDIGKCFVCIIIYSYIWNKNQSHLLYDPVHKINTFKYEYVRTYKAAVIT